MTKGLDVVELGQNIMSVSETNRKLVLQYLIKHPIATRTEIAKCLGLKQATITNIINNFIESEIVSETQPMKGEKGRRSIGIRMNYSKYKMIAVCISKIEYQITVVDFGMKEYEHISERLETGITARTLMDRIHEQMETLLKMRSSKGVIAIGIAVPGPYLRDEMRIPVMSWMSGWGEVDIKTELEEKFHFPVFVEHDANAAAIGEWRFGELEKKSNTLLYINAGNGIGSGLVVNGSIYHGGIGYEGEIGHTSIDYNGELCECGNRGCLEKYCSVHSFSKRVSEKIVKKHKMSILTVDSSLEDALEAVRKGDEVAIEAAKEIGEKFGFGLANAINMFGPDEIIIGGELTKIGQPLLDSIVETVKSRILPAVFGNIGIGFSELGRRAYLLGICELTIDEVIVSGILANHE